MSYISANLNFLLSTVKKVSTALSRDFSEIELLQSSVRGHKEFTAAAVEKIKRALKTELQRARPDYAVVFSGDKRPAASHFLVAPMDGSLNFMHGIPHFAVSVAVVEKGVVTSGVIYNPATGDTYFAEKGNGAFKEGSRSHERLRVSSRKEAADAVIGVSEYMPAYTALAAVRMQGSPVLDLAFVAAGKLDAAVISGSAAEFAAGMLLVKEAGGYVYDANQKDIRTENLAAALDSGKCLAVNAELGRRMHDLINN